MRLAAYTPLTKTDTRPSTETMNRFIEDYRGDHGVKPICRVLQIAPSSFYHHMAKCPDPSLLSNRAKRDD